MMINNRNITLLCLCLLFLLPLMAVTGCQEESTERTLMVGNTTLQYDTSRVQPEMAAKLGRYLLPGLDREMEALVRLDYSDGIWQFQTVSESHYLNNPDYSFNASMAAIELSLMVFDGAETETHLCDGSLNQCMVVKAKDYMIKANTIVAYNSEIVDSAQVEELLAFLVEAEFVDVDFNEETATAEDRKMYYLGYEDNKWQFWKLVFEDRWEDPYVEYGFSYLASMFSHLFFEGEEVEVILSTDWLGEKKVLPGLPQLESSYLDRNLLVYYNSGIVSESDVAEFSAYLIDAGLVPNDLLMMSLNRIENIWFLQIVTPQVLIDDPTHTSIVKDLANDLSRSYFEGEKLVIEICDYVFWPVVVVESS
jgi:hypothetical protein